MPRAVRAVRAARAPLFCAVALLALFFILLDVCEVEKTGGNEAAKVNLKPSLLPMSGATAWPSSSSSSSSWSFNKTLANQIRKDILKFLDAERDVSILKGTLKRGDIVHYVFDRRSTTNVSENLYQLLPSVSPLKHQHYGRCAIVGNSGILLNSSCGQEIDACDYVIRCNLAPVQEYVTDVGQRTSMVTMNPSVVQRAFQDLASESWQERFLQRLDQLGSSVLWIPAFMAKGGEERVEWALDLIRQHAVHVRPAFPSLRLLHAVRGYWLTNNVHIKRPTTGLLMYTLATRFCDQIHLYGFWPFPRDVGGRPVKYHYYDALTYGYTSQAGPHAMPLEFQALKVLHERGALQLHTGLCHATT